MAKSQHHVAERRWRKNFESIIDGFRVNQLPYDAQVFFWKIQHIADDFGNFKMLPAVLSAMLYPESPDGIRPGAVRVAEIVAMLGATDNKAGMRDPLATTYTVDGDTFVHISEYLFFQSPSNGLHQHKVPASPCDVADMRELERSRRRSKEAKENRRNPKESQENRPDIQNKTKNKNKRENNNSKSKRGDAAAVAGFVLSAEEEKAAEALSRQPEWVSEGKGWLSREAARSVIAMRLPNETVAAAVRACWRSRKNIDNPAGWIIAELRKAAEAMKAGAA